MGLFVWYLALWTLNEKIKERAFFFFSFDFGFSLLTFILMFPGGFFKQKVILLKNEKQPYHSA